jgi:hypothetical protein
MWISRTTPWKAAAIALFALLPPSPAAAQLDIPFAPMEDSALRDPDNPTKVFRMDFARVEHDFPLSRADLLRITPENIRNLPQEQIDQIYGRLSAGPIPDGPHQGDLFFARGESFRTRVEEILGGIAGRVASAKIERLETVGRVLWKGKMFYRDERVLRNFIADFQPMRALIDDPSTLMKTRIPRAGLLARIVPQDEVWLLFPAKLYCGQSLLDARRESIIVDYNYADEIAGYQESPDGLAGRGGLRIRDEVRMIRPGFYLGRAYANRAFLLNFTVYNPEVAEREATRFAAGEPVAEDCWPGEQSRKAALR